MDEFVSRALYDSHVGQDYFAIWKGCFCVAYEEKLFSNACASINVKGVEDYLPFLILCYCLKITHTLDNIFAVNCLYPPLTPQNFPRVVPSNLMCLLTESDVSLVLVLCLNLPTY
ncbi:unnamed protein product [Ilex paraguariensis]|uniref:Uncharacterized protein n=1 Tax=Ilex paraguariensis TaxID=185542 RepID=A0ABC8U2R8_9AQUA